MSDDDHPVIRALRETGTLQPRDLNYLLKHGRSYEGTPLPPGTETWGPGKCVVASQVLKERHGWKIVTGWALLPPSVTDLAVPIWHRWNSRDDEHALDGVFPDPERSSYFGLGAGHGARMIEMLGGPRPSGRRSILTGLEPGAFARRLERSFRL
ncbi:hypothetical protein [Methylobacterium sp. NFXW15]|uniref:hypothetical protein n=1 Tax=Methylobacterium sp. NFXW15 TaxID=2819512 RepID=UPI003CF9D0FB